MSRSKLGAWRVPAVAGALCLLSGALVPQCNLVMGAASAAVIGTSAFLAWECYDHVLIDVRDASGRITCDAEVLVSPLAEESWRSVPQCYHVALAPGQWRLRAQGEGQSSLVAPLAVPERTGECPHFTHLVELTLRPPASARRLRQIQREPKL